ncbi:MAG: hypothetical protein ACJZ9F_13120 [Rhodospirillaceae bacterium]
MTLETYSWVFLLFYVGMMVVFGVIGHRRVSNADDYATARGSYGPLFLALAFTSTAASGATFLGIPALAYHFGLSTMWFMFVYPIGLYTGGGGGGGGGGCLSASTLSRGLERVLVPDRSLNT